VLHNKKGHMTEEELRRRILLLCGSCLYWHAVDRQDPSLPAFRPVDSLRCAEKAEIKHFNSFFSKKLTYVHSPPIYFLFKRLVVL